MDCCYFIIFILILVLLMVFAGFILSLLFFAYLAIAGLVNRIIRNSWAKELTDSSYSELQKMLADLEIAVKTLRNLDDGFKASAMNSKNKSLPFGYYTNKVKLDDAEKRANILKSLIRGKQPIEDVRLAEERSKREDEIEKLTLTPEYKHIEQFASKIPENEFDEALSKLLILLESKEWHLTENELRALIRKEKKKQNLEKAKSKILLNHPETRRDILKSYLIHYQPNDEEIIALGEILNERNFSVADSVALKAELTKVKQEIETEKFEKRLANES